MICPKCKGKGRVREEIDWLTGICTLGLGILINLSSWYNCSMCKSKGFIKEEDIL